MSASRRTQTLVFSAVVVVAFALVSCSSITPRRSTQSPASSIGVPRFSTAPTPMASTHAPATPAVGPAATGEVVVPPPIDQFGTPVQGATKYGAPDWVKVGTRMTFSLLTEMNGASLRLGYDSASGVLVTMETTNSTTGITLQLQLTQG